MGYQAPWQRHEERSEFMANGHDPVFGQDGRGFSGLPLSHVLQEPAGHPFCGGSSPRIHPPEQVGVAREQQPNEEQQRSNLIAHLVTVDPVRERRVIVEQLGSDCRRELHDEVDAREQHDHDAQTP